MTSLKNVNTDSSVSVRYVRDRGYNAMSMLLNWKKEATRNATKGKPLLNCQMMIYATR